MVLPHRVVRAGLTLRRIAQVLECLFLGAVALAGGAVAEGAQSISPSLAYAYRTPTPVYDSVAHGVKARTDEEALAASPN